MLPLALVTLIAIAAPAGVPAQPPAAPLPAVAAPHRIVQVQLQTEAGAILLAVETERAPITSANFLRYVDAGKLDGAAFYRAVKVGEAHGLVQGGTRNDPKRTLPPIAHEPTSQTGLSHVDGAISMARAAPGTASGDFFVTVGALTSMDANPAQAGDNLGFAVFGRVVDGMDVIRRIMAAPTSPTEGEGAMKGQMLAPPVRIVSARRLPPAAK